MAAFLSKEFEMKVIVAGGRNFNDYELLKTVCLRLLSHIPKIQISIISGSAKGADSLAIKFAKEYGINFIEFPADWDAYGKRAGYLRNKEMENNATHLIAFWDGSSKGTANMIDLMKKANKNVHIERY